MSRFLALCFSLLLAALAFGAANEKAAPDEKVTLTAKELRSTQTNGETRVTEVKGGTLKQGEMTLTADAMTVTGEKNALAVTATGTPTLKDTVAILTGESITVDTAN